MYDPEVEAERAMLVPADPTWFGRKPKLPPLTSQWAVSAMQPRYQADGSVLRSLTPPAGAHRRPGRIGLAVIAFIVLAVAAFAYGAWSR